jgi:hypothetical protein
MTMSLKSILKSIGRIFTAKNLTAAEAFVAKFLPEFGDDLAKFSAGLAREKTSLFALADEAKALYKASKGADLSTSLATHLAQAALNAAWPEIEKEAVKLLGLK